jgi:polyisoprenoid-binding protein YceI
MTASQVSDDLLLAPGTWTLDPDESTVGFRVFALPPAKGRFTHAEGKLVIDDDHVGVATASVEVDSLKTGIGLRDKHLKSSHFFDAANHPTITFQSDRITQENDDIRLRGTLSMRGNRRPVELAGKSSGPATARSA